MPLGGIGTGTVGLGGRGDLRDWEIMNRPAKGFTPERAFFAVRVAEQDGSSLLRAAEGRIDPGDYEGRYGSLVPGSGLPRFRHATFDAAYPLAQVTLSDPGFPVWVRLEAFNPFVPVDADFSGIPVAVLRYVVSNSDDRPRLVTLCGSMPNLVGQNTDGALVEGGFNTRQAVGDLIGVQCSGSPEHCDAERWGTMAIAAMTSPGDDVTARTNWIARGVGDDLLDFWDDLAADGRLDERASDRRDPVGSVAVTRWLGPGESTTFPFLITWHFPHRRAWVDEELLPGNERTPEIVGNHYTGLWSDAWAVAADVAERYDELESRTVEFVRAFCSSDLPGPVKEAALFNLSTLRSQTCFRTGDGRFYGWEGCNDRSGSCFGSCTHVWNYEPATAHLFGSLARAMREVEFAHATDSDGRMSFRVMLPLDRAQEWAFAAADGQLGCLVKLYREWTLSGDDRLLSALWPTARRALEFCWIPGGWDADRDGVLEGCQHNTMDVEYYGPNPQMGGWYLAALRAAEEMARHLGEDAFAETCGSLFRSGSTWIDDNLFTGSYYRQLVRPVAPGEPVAAGLLWPLLPIDPGAPDYQLGDGCLLDQMVGQVLAHQTGLGHLLDPDHIRTTLESVLRLNRRAGLDAHFNPMRSYALGDENALIMCSYDEGERPRRPFPYYAEVMTGAEYTAAAALAYEGRVDDAVRIVQDVRDRYDGFKRNPFDEAEAGHHYVRALASWGVSLAVTGFRYSRRSATLWLRGKKGARDFWSTGDAWGTAYQHLGDGAAQVRVEVHGGSLELLVVELAGLGTCRRADAASTASVSAGQSVLLYGEGH
ncbi:hypothetical protein GCM10017786_69380 [Amycolatopsis deserti]|uniref:Uncharacterized protein n=2 Tax=Amycolatopsis deserti TaxID=185696 RepID=A0ABQ3JFI3_9PSEU|nr:hypothetical protein GCM10017786_69380 [Amycolatopsis deserti]